MSDFGVRNPQHFQRDLEDIARLGFSSIISTFSAEDHRFYQGSLAEFVVRYERHRYLELPGDRFHVLAHLCRCPARVGVFSQTMPALR